MSFGSLGAVEVSDTVAVFEMWDHSTDFWNLYSNLEFILDYGLRTIYSRKGLGSYLTTAVGPVT